jgi:hypothetical protein
MIIILILFPQLLQEKLVHVVHLAIYSIKQKYIILVETYMYMYVVWSKTLHACRCRLIAAAFSFSSHRDTACMHDKLFY